jgi:hypothetical protein
VGATGAMKAALCVAVIVVVVFLLVVLLGLGGQPW